MYEERLKSIEERMIRLQNQIREIEPSNEEYALKNKELAKWEESYPEFITNHSPTQKEIPSFEGEMMLCDRHQLDIIQDGEVLIERLKDINHPVSIQVWPKGIELELHYSHGRFQYACTADDKTGVRDVTATIAFSRDIPRSIPYEEILTIKGCLFHTISFRECHPGIGLMNEDVDVEAMRNRRVMVRENKKVSADLSLLKQLGFLVPYHRLYAADRLQEIINDCEWIFTSDTGYELEGVILSAGDEEKLLYRPSRIKNRLDGKTVVITGVLSKRRYDFRKDIEDLGGTLAGTVTKTVDFLLMGNNGTGTTKYQKAIKLGIPIITEEQFKEKYNVK